MVENKQIEIKPGMGKTSEIIYEEQGNEAYGHRPANLLVKINEKSEKKFKKNGNDLIYNHEISVVEAIHAEPAIIVRRID